MMRADLVLCLVAAGLLILPGLLSRGLWRAGKTPSTPPQPTRRQGEPKPFAGYTRKPACELCEQGGETHPQMPGPPPPRLLFTQGRRRQIDTSGHFCLDTTCAYHGWDDWGNIRANSHPGGRRWRQLVCLSCHGYVLETHGTPFPGKQVDPDTLVGAMAALTEGLGIRAVARVTVLTWLVEAAEHLETFSRYHVRALHVEQMPRDELFALLSAVKEGEVTEAQALKRLSRSLNWVWVAMDPVCKLILTVDVGERTLAMAQRLVHQLTQVLAPECAPLFLTDDFREYLTARVSHYGQWLQPERRQAKGPPPKPRWMPLPGLLYAQMVKGLTSPIRDFSEHSCIFPADIRLCTQSASCTKRLEFAQKV